MEFKDRPADPKDYLPPPESKWIEGPDPSDRLTRLAEEISANLEASGNEGVQAIIMLSDKTHHGIKGVGYADSAEIVAEMLMFVKSAFEASGKDFLLVDQDGEEILNV